MTTTEHLVMRLTPGHVLTRNESDAVKDLVADRDQWKRKADDAERELLAIRISQTDRGPAGPKPKSSPSPSPSPNTNGGDS